MIKVIFNYITNSRPVRVILEVSKRKIVLAFKFIPHAGKFYTNLTQAKGVSLKKMSL